MRYETQVIRIGESCGPVDWTHPTAKDKPQIWREAEKDPSLFTIDGRDIIQICMYDGGPYWTSRPAIQYIELMKHARWIFFNSYGVRDNSIQRRAP